MPNLARTAQRRYNCGLVFKEESIWLLVSCSIVENLHSADNLSSCLVPFCSVWCPSVLQIWARVVIFPLHIVSTVCFGIFSCYGPVYRNSNPAQGQVSSSLLHISQSPQSREIPLVVSLLPRQSCTTPSSWEVTSTSSGTEVEIKVAAKTASTGTLNTMRIVTLCISTSWLQFLELLQPSTLNKYLAVITHQKCQSQEVKCYTHNSLCVIFDFH